MLHDGAVRFLAQAATATSQKDSEKKSESLNKAIAIVDHLWDTLDKEQGGEIAENLERIYQFMHTQLVWANANDDVKIMKQVMVHLRDIRESWAAVDTQLKTSKVKPSQDKSRTVKSGGLDCHADEIHLAA